MWYLVHFVGVYYPALWNHIICLFCSKSRPWIEFSVLSCSRLGCVDRCKVILLCLWILCGILSVLQGIIHGLRSKFFLLFMLLIFSTSSVSMLLVCNCLEHFFCLDPFGLMWSFLSSSSQVLVLFVSICSFLVLVYRKWCWSFGTRSHVFYHGLAFSSWIFFQCRFE